MLFYIHKILMLTCPGKPDTRIMMRKRQSFWKRNIVPGQGFAVFPAVDEKLFVVGSVFADFQLVLVWETRGCAKWVVLEGCNC